MLGGMVAVLSGRLGAADAQDRGAWWEPGTRPRVVMAIRNTYFLCSSGMEGHLMAVTSFDVDERTAALLAELQKTFGVKTNAAVLRKALALANVASQYADADNTITITPGEGKPAVKVSLAG
jgi:hypothetical protein